MSKEKMFLVRIDESTCEPALKDMMENSGVERGLKLPTSLGKEFFTQIKMMAKRGYYFCGVIVDEGENAEFLFQRHPKQTEAHKLSEIKPPEALKYKI